MDLSRSAYRHSRYPRLTWIPMPPVHPSDNLDMLAWFGEEERHVCGACGERACVSLPGALGSFCFACTAVTVDGQRIDVERRLPLA